jgi:hypothetical protein
MNITDNAKFIISHSSTFCLNCGSELDTSIEENFECRLPITGDISICVYCGLVTTFDDNLETRLLTEDEISELSKDKRILLLTRFTKSGSIIFKSK